MLRKSYCGNQTAEVILRKSYCGIHEAALMRRHSWGGKNRGRGRQRQSERPASPQYTRSQKAAVTTPPFECRRMNADV